MMEENTAAARAAIHINNPIRARTCKVRAHINNKNHFQNIYNACLPRECSSVATMNGCTEEEEENIRA
jgi:hypothetical protein